MRKILYALKELRKGQLSDSATPEHPISTERLAEVEDKFAFLDGELNGIKPTGTNERLMEVMTSGDFTYAIQEFVQRAAQPGYQRMGFAFEPLVKMETVPNYLLVTRYQNRAGVDDLEYVGEKAPARPGSVDDATKRQFQVFRFEKQYDFSHEALVNDDIGYFNDVATKMGEAARRSLEKYVSRMYTNAVTTARLVALGALYAQNGRLTSARISEARMAFGQRTDARSEPISADLAYIVYHRGLEDVVRTIQNSQLVPELATNAANVVKSGWTGIKDPYITGTAPNLPWWAFTGPANGIIPFVLARRQGMPGPLILRKRSDIEAVSSLLGNGTPVNAIWGDFNSGNIVLKVVDVWGTYINATDGNMYDHRGSYYSTGTAP